MRFAVRGLFATIIVASTLTMGGCQKSTQAKAKSARTDQTTLTTLNKNLTSDRWIVTNNRVFIPIIDKLGEQIAQARQDYLQGDNNAAAIAMRQGSAYLMQEMPNVSTKAQVHLKQASDELMEKASLVQMGEIDSVQELERILVRAYLADTQHRWLYADETEWLPLVEMPGQHFSTAKQDFLSADYSAAAAQIRQAAELIKLETNRTRDSELKSRMLSAAHSLEQLAEAVQQNKINDVEQLDKAFAAGQLAMGDFFNRQARQSESRGELELAGRETIAAFKQIQAANTWIDQDAANLKQAQVERNLVRDSLGLPREVQSQNLNRAIATIDKQIDAFSQELAK